MNDDKMRAGETQAAAIDEKRRMILKATLGGAAFAVPLMSSFSLEGLTFGSAAQAQIIVAPFLCNMSNATGGIINAEPATASIGDDGELLVTLNLPVNCAGFVAKAEARAQVLYRCTSQGSGKTKEEQIQFDEVLTEEYLIPADKRDFRTQIQVILVLRPKLPCKSGLKPVAQVIRYSGIEAVLVNADNPKIRNLLLPVPGEISISY